MKNNLDEIIEKAQSKENENQEFRMFLKGYDHHQVDKIVHRLYQKHSSTFDCTACGKCCKKLTVIFTEEETTKIARYLNISIEEFEKKYIDRKIPLGYILKGTHCPFLKTDNKCTIYDTRPQICRSYPHLHKNNINHRLLNIIDNSYICPLVHYVLEDLKKELWHKKW